MASKFGVQTLVIAALALVIGLVVGGAGPRAELRSARDEIFELKKKGSATASQSGTEFAKILARSFESRREAADAAQLDPTLSVIPREDRPDVPDLTPPREVKVGKPASDEESFETAKQVLAVRAAQARAALMEDAEPSADQVAQIDQALADMNQQLMITARQFADDVKIAGEPPRRDMMNYGAETLAVLVDAEDRLLNTLTPEQRAAVREEATNPLSFVDPEVLSVIRDVDPAAFGGSNK